MLAELPYSTSQPEMYLVFLSGTVAQVLATRRIDAWGEFIFVSSPPQ